MRLFTILFFISIIKINLYGQSTQILPFFSEDLNTISQQKYINLKPNNTNAVRGRVADFIPSVDSCYTISKNEREKELSVSFWFLPQQLDVHSGTLIGEDGLFYFRYLSNRQIQFNHFHKSDLNTGSLLSNNVWQHLGFTLSREGELAIYYNGDAVLREKISENWWKQEKGKLILGNDRYGVKAEGSIDRLKLWNTVLNEADFKKEFETTSLQTNLYYKLQAYLPLNGGFKDKSSKPKDVELVKGIDFIKDTIKGEVANFKSESSVLKLTDLTFENQITIASWVKPIIKNGVVGIAGNKDFSFRYKPSTQSLWFSVPMMFKSVSTQQQKVSGDWVHIALTANYNHEVNFYLNGELVDRKAIGGNTGKEDYLEIGKSLWGNTFNGQMSQFAIWSKVLSQKEIKAVFEGQLEADRLLFKKTNNNLIYWVGICLVLILLLVLVFFKRKKNQSKVATPIARKEFPKKNIIFLFDKFRAFDNEGNDVSHEFTPTLIRLFSLILFFPRLTTRCISSSELSDVLWETDNVAQQKNNRGTNMHRLRKILKGFDGISLNYEGRKWKFSITDALFIDVENYNAMSPSEILAFPYKNLQLNKPLKTKNFDSIILQLNEKHVEKLRDICVENFENKNWISLRKGAKLWLSIDPLSEKALRYQVTALKQLNERQLALSRYESFAANYQRTLNEAFHLSFEDCMF